MKKVLLALFMSTVILAGCSGDEAPDEPLAVTNEPEESETPPEIEPEAEDEVPVEDGSLTLGSTFEFDDLEITIGTDITWLEVDNEFSDNHGETVFRLPITVTNLSDETNGFNMFFMTRFGSNGTQLDSISAFFDNDIDWAGEMRSGATMEAYMHILYDGDGEYALEFNDWSDRIEVVFQVQQ